MVRAIKKRMEVLLRRHPPLFRLASKSYHFLNRSSAALSTGAPDALRQAFQKAQQLAAGPIGDYYEFGLFRGGTFWVAQQLCRELDIADCHFYGFDSFSGLPPIEGVDSTNRQFFEGQFACSKKPVVRNLTKHGVDWERTTLIEGFFADSLTEETKLSHPFRQVAVALIDCDLYASTCVVLRWINSLLGNGSIVLFDDWNSFGPNSNIGQQLAFREYLEANPQFRAEQFFEFEPYGVGFMIWKQ